MKKLCIIFSTFLFAIWCGVGFAISHSAHAGLKISIKNDTQVLLRAKAVCIYRVGALGWEQSCQGISNKKGIFSFPNNVKAKDVRFIVLKMDAPSSQVQENNLIVSVSAAASCVAYANYSGNSSLQLPQKRSYEIIIKYLTGKDLVCSLD